MKRVITVLLLVVVALGFIPGSAAVLGSGTTYTVQPGDSLSEIAAEHGTTVTELVRLNADRYPSLKSNPGLIEPGWVLVLPGGNGETGGGETLWERVIAWARTRAIPALQRAGRELAAPPRPLARQSGTSATPGENGAVIQIGDPTAEEAILTMFNEERQSRGLPLLATDDSLHARACERTQDMLQRGYFSHYDPVTGEVLIGDAGGEIIARGYSSPTGLARGWWNSQAHYTVMTYPDWHRAGICVGHRGYLIITAMFWP
jgi:uncharacterized protein YkwD